MNDTISKFLKNHKRLCPANIGKDCTCELFKARAEFAALQTRITKLEKRNKQLSASVQKLLMS